MMAWILQGLVRYYWDWSLQSICMVLLQQEHLCHIKFQQIKGTILISEQ